MDKTWLVLKNEFLSVILRKSFWITLILLPVAGFIFSMVVSASSGGKANVVSEIVNPEAGKQKVEGYVDESRLIRSLPPDAEDALLAYDNEENALAALRAGEISAYYIIPADYLLEGRITYVRPDYNPLGGLTSSRAMSDTLAYNLLNNDATLFERVNDPMKVEVTYLSDQPARNPDSALTFFVPYVVTLLFYAVIISSASLMLSSVASEKKNQVMEVLMTSMTPTQMLAGKIIALGAAGLVQTLVWSLIGYLLLQFNANRGTINAVFELPPSILLWGVVFFLLGYGLYGSLMAGVGALVPGVREASQLTTVIIMPLIIPLMFISNLATQPNGALSVVLSLFPFTAPVSMMARLSATLVPWWQIGIAIVLLLGTVVLVVRAVAGMFRAQTLLTGQQGNLKIFVRALLGRA